MSRLTNRVHIFANPTHRTALIRCLSEALGGGEAVELTVPGRDDPVLAWTFPDGGSMSVEFTTEALERPQPSRDAWLEFQAADPDAVKRDLTEAGSIKIEHLGRDYLVLPGGQVVRIAQLSATR